VVLPERTFANSVADQRWLFVAAIGSREVVRFDRQASPPTKQTVQIGVRPDNLRWDANGKLYTVGGNFVAPADCASPPCPSVTRFGSALSTASGSGICRSLDRNGE
jgi:hypothetical protein